MVLILIPSGDCHNDKLVSEKLISPPSAKKYIVGGKVRLLIMQVLNCGCALYIVVVSPILAVPRTKLLHVSIHICVPQKVIRPQHTDRSPNTL